MNLGELLLHESDDVFIRLGEDYLIQEVSHSFERLWLHSAETAVGRHILNFVYDADLKRTEESLTFEEAVGGILELRIVKYNRELAWNRLSWKRLTNGAGYLLTLHPIAPLSERELRIKLNEAALTDSEKIARMGSWWVNVNTKENRWSDGNFALWNLPVQESPPPVSWVMSQLVPEDATKVIEAMEEVQRTGEPIELMFRIPDPKKGMRFIISRLRPWYVQGRLLEVKGVNFEVTDLIQANHELERRNEELNHRNEQMRNYAFLNSHHVRGPLSSILGLIELMREEPKSSLHYLHLIEQCAHELDTVIRKINLELGTIDPPANRKIS